MTEPVSERPYGQPALVNQAPAGLGPSGFDQAQDRGSEGFGRALERYVVVQWLKEQARVSRYKDHRQAAWMFAEAIGKGEHLS